MKLVGLITEYNPFHNGHLYHIERSIEAADADGAIVVMSGNFVQRGMPAVFPKRLRAECAVRSGAAAVFELPACYSTGSAEFFAEGAVRLLDSLGCVDFICFGTECGDLKWLKKCAAILTAEPESFSLILKQYLKNGHPFPLARQMALSEYMPGLPADVLESPNNILGIEYLKALNKIQSRMLPYTIQRTKDNYHDLSLEGTDASASAIRNKYNHLSDTDMLFAQIGNVIPQPALEIIKEAHHIRGPVTIDDFSLLLRSALLRETPETLLRIQDMSPELASRICKSLNSFTTFSGFCSLLKTRELTYSRISRALLHLLLEVRKSDVESYRIGDGVYYAKLLAFRRESSRILSVVKESSRIPVISKTSRAGLTGKTALCMYETDLYADLLYETVTADKWTQPFLHEFCQSPVIV